STSKFTSDKFESAKDKVKEVAEDTKDKVKGVAEDTKETAKAKPRVH
ncbi:Asp23/Gls24 family envelope stress response protein, partial [Streptococcus thermophilus]|nr:Asp23/Gls24 family envelope stress response protein [Streptococcus thermophilus]